MPHAWLKVPGADVITQRYIAPIANIVHKRMPIEHAAQVGRGRASHEQAGPSD
jgi:hypothetical protein